MAEHRPDRKLESSNLAVLRSLKNSSHKPLTGDVDKSLDEAVAQFNRLSFGDMAVPPMDDDDVIGEALAAFQALVLDDPQEGQEMKWNKERAAAILSDAISKLAASGKEGKHEHHGTHHFEHQQRQGGPKPTERGDEQEDGGNNNTIPGQIYGWNASMHPPHMRPTLGGLCLRRAPTTVNEGDNDGNDSDRNSRLGRGAEVPIQTIPS